MEGIIEQIIIEGMLNKIKGIDPLYYSTMKSYSFEVWNTLSTSIKLCKNVGKIPVK